MKDEILIKDENAYSNAKSGVAVVYEDRIEFTFNKNKETVIFEYAKMTEVCKSMGTLLSFKYEGKLRNVDFNKKYINDCVEIAKGNADAVKKALENKVAEEEKESDLTKMNAEELYHYCNEKGFGHTFTNGAGTKHFQVILNNLLPDEKILMVFMGIHNSLLAGGSSNCAYAITNKRILIGNKSLLGEFFKTVSLDNINDITLKSELMTGYVIFDSLKDKFDVYFSIDEAKKVSELSHKILDDMKRISKPVNTVSVADELKKFKELLDMGAITEEEYNKKKEELLKL